MRLRHVFLPHHHLHPLSHHLNSFFHRLRRGMAASSTRRPLRTRFHGPPTKSSSRRPKISPVAPHLLPPSVTHRLAAPRTLLLLLHLLLYLLLLHHIHPPSIFSSPLLRFVAPPSTNASALRFKTGYGPSLLLLQPLLPPLPPLPPLYASFAARRTNVRAQLSVNNAVAACTRPPAPAFTLTVTLSYAPPPSPAVAASSLVLLPSL